MTKFKLLQRPNKINNVGEGPIYLRMTENRKVTYMTTGIVVKSTDWNKEECRVKKTHPNSTRVNALLSKFISDMEMKVLDRQIKNLPINFSELKKKSNGKDQSNFFDLADDFIKDLYVTGNYSGYKRTGSIIKKLKQYVNKQSLPLEEMDVTFIRNYQVYLSNDCKNGINTIHSNLKVIRRLLNLAIDRGLLKEGLNPFNRISIKTQESQKDYLTPEELERLENLPLDKNLKKTIYRDMYIFSAYSGGIRISDLLQLKWKNYNGERVEFFVQKTKRIQSVKLPNKAIEIVENYRLKIKEINIGEPDKEDFIFPILDRSYNLADPIILLNKISSANARINQDLKDLVKQAQIDKKISFHTSRHTFATQALRKGMRMEYVSKILGHKDLKETQVYAKIVNEELDKAMEIFNQ